MSGFRHSYPKTQGEADREAWGDQAMADLERETREDREADMAPAPKPPRWEGSE